MSTLLFSWVASATVALTPAGDAREVREAEEPAVRESLPTEPDDVAWRAPGFRLGLGYVLDGVMGVGGVPGGPHHTATLRLGVRLDDGWSVFVGLRYGAHLGASSSLRFSGTIEPTLNLTESLALSVGAGIAGLIVSSTGAPTPKPDIVAPYTFESTTPLLGACSGTGFIGLVRLEQTWIIGSLFSTGPTVQLDAQWTRCTQATGRTDPDSAQAIELHQYWVSFGISAGWLLWWR